MAAGMTGRARGRRGAVLAMVATGAIVLAGCGSSSPPTTTTTTTTTMPSAVKNLAVTPSVRAALLAAGAASHNLTAADYTGLAAGQTYYAYDSATGTYWAGAALVPSASSTPAQVSNQDDGAYLIFTMLPGQHWVVFNDGLGGMSGAHCAVVVPAAVRTVWGWSLSTPCGIAPARAG